MIALIAALSLVRPANAVSMFSGHYAGPAMAQANIDIEKNSVRDIMIRTLLLDCLIVSDQILVSNNQQSLRDLGPTQSNFKAVKGDFSAALAETLAVFQRQAGSLKTSARPFPLDKNMITFDVIKAQTEVPAQAEAFKALRSNLENVCAEALVRK